VQIAHTLQLLFCQGHLLGSRNGVDCVLFSIQCYANVCEFASALSFGADTVIFRRRVLDQVTCWMGPGDQIRQTAVRQLRQLPCTCIVLKLHYCGDTITRGAPGAGRHPGGTHMHM
jgi:hypothetical protein